MSTDTHTHLSTLCDAYASHFNVSHWRVSFLARGDGQFFKKMREGKSCTLRTATRVFQWFSDHWPTDLEWPADVPRPPKSGDAS
jgi:hypothetical protein